jgi:hypothetical protein
LFAILPQHGGLEDLHNVSLFGYWAIQCLRRGQRPSRIHSSGSSTFEPEFLSFLRSLVESINPLLEKTDWANAIDPELQR